MNHIITDCNGSIAQGKAIERLRQKGYTKFSIVAALPTPLVVDTAYIVTSVAYQPELAVNLEVDALTAALGDVSDAVGDVSDAVGDITTLATTDKDSIVAAVNELNAYHPVG